MITIDSDPKINPIFIGARILVKLSESDYTQVAIEDLYEDIKYEFETSYEVFTYSLDWLYIIGAVDLNENGFIEYATDKVDSL
ncbi:ABC-three component system middle component 6 [Microbulbifer sp. ZKSA002]|uniref:ABC-three component system middle component 6 n=1 Tax=Microbulbifer sp. ZKSA002 TaxID=3243388 RepID=UPI00403A3B6A